MRLLIVALLIAFPCLAAAEQTITHDGETRRYWIEPPMGPRPAPAIVVLHGATAVPSRMRRVAHFTLHQKGWVEIYPAGLGRRWNDGRTVGDDEPLHEADDLGFLGALIDRLAAEGLVDPDRVFFAGISNGGAMVLRVICEAPEMAAGAAVVAMNMPEGMECAEGPPVPFLHIHGTADPLVPFAGGPIEVRGHRRGRVLSAAETAARFALRNGCGPYEEIAISDHFPGDGTRVKLHVYRGCTAPLRQYIVEGGGHTWPGTDLYRRFERMLGGASRDISATFEIESFFADQLGR